VYIDIIMHMSIYAIRHVRLGTYLDNIMSYLENKLTYLK
jgi:hypothetical protein